MQDFAHQMRWMLDEAYSDVPIIRLVHDTLNTHRVSVRDLSGPGGPAHRQAVGVPPHAQAWKLSEYGRDRVQCAGLGLTARTQRRCGRPGNTVNTCVSEGNGVAATIDWRFTSWGFRHMT